MSDLPSGWVETTIGEIAETRLGKMLSAKARGGEGARPYLRNKSVQWGWIDLDDVLTMDFSEEELERFRVLPGDLLVCEGGEVGRAAIWRGQLDWVGYQKALHRVRPQGGIAPEYLLYLFMWLAQTGAFERHVTGSTIKHLPQEDLRRVRLALPPLNEQRRIVAAIEEHLSRLDAAEASVGSGDTRLGALRQRLLDALGRNGEVVALRSVLVEPLVNGRSVPTQDDGFPVLRLSALRDGYVDVNQRKLGAWDEADAARFLVRDGDFFVARGNGSLRLVGRGGLVVNQPDPVAFPDTLIRVRVDHETITSHYLRLIWDSRAIRDQIERRARTTAGIYKVNQQDLRDIELPLPSLADQRRIVQEVEERLSSIDALRSAIERAQRRSAALRRSVLERAFRGELVPQDPSDEPAEALLARIRAEPKDMQAVTRRGK